MKAQIAIQDDKAIFLTPIKLKPDAPKYITIDIPDDYILEKDSEMQQQVEGRFSAKDMRKEIEAITGQKTTQSLTSDRLDAILGKWRRRGGDSGADVYKAMWHAHLEGKYLGQR